MSKLQPFHFEKSLYERPNQKWICGRARDGHCCLTGPDAQGNCTATAECRPLRKGDRWHCTRPGFLGGPCAEGPRADGQCCRQIPKCSPVRSLRSWRGVTVLMTVAATLAALMLVFASKNGDRMLSPGPLSVAHRSLGDNCSECHERLEARPARWFMAAADVHSAHGNSRLCLNCHNLGRAPLQPHSLNPALLQSLTQASLEKNGAGAPPAGLRLAAFIPRASHADEGLACATCHQEHHGKEADLKQLANNQCQSCHATQFASFSDGHPQFTRYPFERRTRIIFDHETHIRQHFRDPAVTKSAPTSCLDCHEPDLRGGTMAIKPFAAICAACHDDQIKAKFAVKAGIPFIGVPRMDDRALAGKYSIGEWPEDADQPVTPFLRLALAGDPQLREALDRLAGVDLAHLPRSDTNQLQAAQKLAWGIKSLLFDLGTGGQDELARRIELGLGQTLTDSEKEGAVAFFNAESLRATFREAFPHLQKEVLEYRKNGKSASTKLVPSPDLPSPGPVKVAPPETWVSQGGWYSPEGSFTIYYHPRGHADRFLSSWMNISVDAGHTADPLGAEALFRELSAPAAPGLCSKCHSIDDTPVKLVNWLGSRPDPLEHKFNRFRHSTHLSLLDARGCFTCHSLNENPGDGQETYAAAFAPGRRDPLVFRSNFRTIDKSTCASCHAENLVREDCLLCHNYHIGRFKPVIPHAKILAASEPAKD